MICPTKNLKSSSNNNLFYNNIADTEKTYRVVSASISWSYPTANINNTMHSLEGNKKLGDNIAAWNCRRGLLNPDGTGTNHSLPTLSMKICSLKDTPLYFLSLGMLMIRQEY